MDNVASISLNVFDVVPKSMIFLSIFMLILLGAILINYREFNVTMVVMKVLPIFIIVYMIYVFISDTAIYNSSIEIEEEVYDIYDEHTYDNIIEKENYTDYNNSDYTLTHDIFSDDGLFETGDI